MSQPKKTNKAIKICFVALVGYPLLSGKVPEDIKGPAVHQTLLAKELVKHDFVISYITYDEGGPPVEHINGIEIIKTYRLTDISRLNPISKAFRIWKAMRKAKADIYFYHGGASGVVPIFCRLMQKKFVYNIASDAYVSRQTRDFKLVDRFGHWLDIKLANTIIAMNEFQKNGLKQNFGRESTVIRNHFPLTRREIPEKAKPPIVLRVGSMSNTKNPALFLRLAEAMPEEVFQMIGGMGDDQALYSVIKERARRIPNLEFLGVIPFSEINKYYSRAAILVNTSAFESYPPYAFIQAWMNYTPVVTLNCNPDASATMHKNKMGLHSRTFEQLVKDVKTLLENELLRKEMGENARRYVEKNHDITKIVKQHVEVLNQLVGLR